MTMMTIGEKSVSQLNMQVVDCPLCKDDRFFEFLVGTDQAYGVPGEFRLVKCLGCGHVYMNPQPSADSLAACYPSGYSQHRLPKDAGQTVETTPESYQPSRLRWLKAVPGVRACYRWLTDNRSQVLPKVDLRGRRALELGCATGDFLNALHAAGYQAQGIELVPAAAAIARSRGFEVHVGTLASAELPGNTFDDVFAWMVLEHVPDPRETLAELGRLLRPGGWFCFSVPNFGSVERTVFGRWWKGYDLPRHLQHFRVRQLRKLLGECGFGDVQIIHQPSFLYWIGSLGAWRCDRRPDSRWGRTLVQWFYDNPPLWVHVVLGPFAHVQAWLKQSGRITLLAQKQQLGERDQKLVA